jgi:hypothetical protein
MVVFTDVAVSPGTSNCERLQINRETAPMTFYASPDPGAGNKRAKGLRTGLVFIK